MNIMKWSIVGSILGLFLQASAGFAWEGPAASRSAISPLQHPEQFNGIAEAEGRIQAINPGQGALFLVDASDKQWQIQVTPETQIKNKDNRDLSLENLKKNDRVHIYFNTMDKSARQIDLVDRLWSAS